MRLLPRIASGTGQAHAWGRVGRSEQIRDAIQQDGTKAREARVTVHGQLAEEAGHWTLAQPNNGPKFTLVIDGGAPSAQYAMRSGAASVTGTITNLTLSPMPLTVLSVEPD
jgi:hypothetical protein